MRQTNPLPIGPFNFSFVIVLIRWSIISSEAFSLGCKLQLAVNCTFVHKSIVIGTKVFQVQSTFFSRSRKRFARLCIKVEKKFNTTRLNGALGGQKNGTWTLRLTLVYWNLWCYIGNWSTRNETPARRPMPARAAAAPPACTHVVVWREQLTKRLHVIGVTAVDFFVRLYGRRGRSRFNRHLMASMFSFVIKISGWTASIQQANICNQSTFSLRWTISWDVANLYLTFLLYIWIQKLCTLTFCYKSAYIYMLEQFEV
jgi:hypothetical protein